MINEYRATRFPFISIISVRIGKPEVLRLSILAANRKHLNIVKASRVVKEWPFNSHPLISAVCDSVFIADR